MAVGYTGVSDNKTIPPTPEHSCASWALIASPAVSAVYMPRFSVAFGRRKSGADNFDNAAPAESSFRVLERSEVVGGKSFDGGATPAVTKPPGSKRSGSDVTVDDNIFAGLKSNR